MRKRGDVSSKIKAMAALEAIKAHEPIGAIARRYKVHPIQVGKWRKQLVGEMHRVFEDEPDADGVDPKTPVRQIRDEQRLR